MDTPLVIDICIAGAVLLFALVGYFRGLVRSLAGLAATAAAVYLSYFFSGQWVGKAMALMFPNIRESIAGSVDFGSMSVNIPILGNVGLDRLGIDTADLTENVAEKIASAAMGVMQPLVRIILFLILLIVFMIALKIAVFLIDKLFELPVLSTVNKLLGLVFGLAEGLLLVFAVVAAFRALGLGFFEENAEGSLLLPLIMSANPIRFDVIWPLIKGAVMK